MKKKFEKKAESPKVLFERMQKRGLATDKDGEAALYDAFRQMGYYRFTGFCLPFQKAKPKNSNFVDGTTVQHILRLYNFDTELRALCGKALERLEVSIRVAICDHMARRHSDPHWYTKQKHYEHARYHQSTLNEAAYILEFDLANDECFAPNGVGGRPKFLEHYYANYKTPNIPPCWMLSEVASFGFWSTLYKRLTQQDRTQIASRWLFPDKQMMQPILFSDWLWSISIFRNRCAHHSRITHRVFPFSPLLPRDNKSKALFKSRTSDLSALLLVIALLLRSSAQDYHWVDELRVLFEDYSDIDLTAATGVGAEAKSGDWRDDPIWHIDKLAK